MNIIAKTFNEFFCWKVKRLTRAEFENMFPTGHLSMTCTKVRYANERSARKRLREIKRKRAQRRHHQAKIERRVYRCELCGAWHLTSLPYDD